MNRAMATALLLSWVVAGQCLFAQTPELGAVVDTFVKSYCLDCHSGEGHSGEGAEANLDLEAMLDVGVEHHFRQWDAVIEKLRHEKMPPRDAAQPVDVDRTRVISRIQAALDQFVTRNAGDPGPVVIRRLSSAEIDYTVADLTGVDLPLERMFDNDAVGGEGFTNVGGVQFMDDAGLERYLEAANRIAAHAVVGAGPISFFHTPGDSGRELSAMERIERIHRAHGFLAAGGEEAEPYGLHRYVDAFFVAWQYRYQEPLGRQQSLNELAEQRSLSPKFARHIWQQLHLEHPPFPLDKIVQAWNDLPALDDDNATDIQTVYRRCEDLYALLNDWQGALATPVSTFEDAPVLTPESVQITTEQRFRAKVSVQPGATSVHARISVESLNDQSADRAFVIWRELGIRLLNAETFRPSPEPIGQHLSEAFRERFGFGKSVNGVELGANEFMMAQGDSIEFELDIPLNTQRVEVYARTELDAQHSDDCLVRCSVTILPQPALDRGNVDNGFSMLARPDGDAVKRIRDDMVAFARVMPQASHRAAAPSDRDPIPDPFDNTYESDDRDYFHYNVKYYRDDAFLTDTILDDDTRIQLDDAWDDLLTSFEYHDILWRFYKRKFQIEIDANEIAAVTRQQIDSLPPPSREIVVALREQYDHSYAGLRAAEGGQLDDVLRLASRAWRRPLTDVETTDLQNHYHAMRHEGTHGNPLDHEDAIRLLLARVFVSPAFLYRIERPAPGDGIAPVSSHELATRLSYFLWASTPDQELMRAAAAGELVRDEPLRAQVGRMLADERARRLAREFFGQWLGFYQFDTRAKVDVAQFPQFTERVRQDMYAEAVAYFDHVVRRDVSISDMLHSDYTFLTRDLAEYYGMDVHSTSLDDKPQLVRDVNRYHRGGAMRLGAVLTATSLPQRTSAVKRGDWILRRLLNTPPPPPPPGVGSIDDADATDGLSIRARLDAHRSADACAACHARIDPLGFALENYDAIGRWRESYEQGQTIDVTGTTNEGRFIDGPAGLTTYLQDHSTLFHRTLATKLLSYALGRGGLLSDRPLIEQMTAALDNDARFSDLVMLIVASRQFRTIRGGSQLPSHPAQQGIESTNE